MFSHHEEQRENVDVAAGRALGVASFGIGLTEIAMPRQVERWLGIGDGENTGILRALGVREIMHGVDILSHKKPAHGVWGRVIGDVLDGVLLGIAAKKTRNPAGFATICAMVAGIAVADLIFAQRLSKDKGD
jgi:hypothetical protein